ncbi:hypothetical protein [Sinorhizobium fredii]
MRLVPTRQALQLTGLSPAKLREWTSRRALIPIDVPPRSQGSSGQYSWQTILVLRLAVTLKEKFSLELQAHRGIFDSLHRYLKNRSFIALWDKTLALRGPTDWQLVDESTDEPLRVDAIMLRLNPHLEVLAEGFALPGKFGGSAQLDLFPASPIGSRRSQDVAHARTPSTRYASRRRRSA